MRNACLIGLLGLTLGGCANFDTLGGGPSVGQNCDEKLGQSVELQLNLAREMLDNGRAHAALANLETLPPNSLEVRESKALALRRIGDPKARIVYEGLLGTCKAAEAHHGLGQIAMRAGNTVEAERELREAARLQPTNSSLRNDLGYVLLRRGDMEKARFEFITAMELNEHDKLPATNLLSVMFIQGETNEATRLIQSVGLSADQVRAAQDQAKDLRPISPASPASQPAVQVESVSYVNDPVEQAHPELVESTPAVARDAKLLVKAR
ncbi:MAG: tetratricopeptide repeat protein [Pseudomonas sp.]